MSKTKINKVEETKNQEEFLFQEMQIEEAVSKVNKVNNNDELEERLEQKLLSQTYTREQLANSKRFAGKQDLVMSLVKVDEELTIEQLETKIKNYLNTEVK